MPSYSINQRFFNVIMSGLFLVYNFPINVSCFVSQVKIEYIYVDKTLTYIRNFNLGVCPLQPKTTEGTLGVSASY